MSIIYNILSFSSARMVSMLITLISLPLFTRLLTPAEYGTVALYSSYLAVISPIIALGLHMSAGTASIYFKENFFSYITNISRYALIPTSVTIGIIIILSNQIQTAITIHIYYLYLIPIHAFSASVLALYISQHQFGGKTIIATTLIVAQSVISFVTSYAMIKLELHDHNAVNRIIGLLVFDLCFAIVFMCYTKLDMKNNKAYFQFAKPYIIPFIIAGICHTLNANIDRIIISMFLDNSTVGVYSTGVTIGLIVFSLMNAIKQGLNRYIYQSMEIAKTSELNDLHSFYITISNIALIALLLCSHILGEQVLPIEYHGVLPLIPLFLASSYILAINQIEVEPLLFRKQTRVILITVMIGTTVNTSINYYFIPHYGIVAAAFSTVISLMVMRIAYVGTAIIRKQFPLTTQQHVVIILMIIYTLIQYQLDSELQLGIVLLLNTTVLTFLIVTSLKQLNKIRRIAV